MQPCRDACLARAPQNAPPHRRRLHVKAGTGLAPTPPIKCLHHDSDTARVLDRGRSRREWSIPHRTAAQETPARTRRYWPCTHAPHKLPASRFRYSPNARPRPSMLRCVLSTCTPHRTAAQQTPSRTGRYWPCTTPADKMPALQIRNSPNAGPRSITSRVEHPTSHRRTGDACTYRPVLALHPRPR